MTTSTPLRLTVRCESDVLALVPFVLGFHPEASLVMLTVTDIGAPVHARVDLPAGRGDEQAVALIADQLVGAAVRNGAHAAMLVAYSDDESLAEESVAGLTRGLEAAGVGVLVALRADGRRWFRVGSRGQAGTPYDVAAHRFSAWGVLEGRVTYRSRRELESTLDPSDEADLDAVRQALARAPEPGEGAGHAAELRWLRRTVAYRLRKSRALSPDAVARLVRALSAKPLREGVWRSIDRAGAEAHVDLWREVVRRSPPDQAVEAAALLAFSAWLAGDGALAWCAVDRVAAVRPDHVLAGLVASALQHAVPPSTWDSGPEHPDALKPSA